MAAQSSTRCRAIFTARAPSGLGPLEDGRAVAAMNAIGPAAHLEPLPKETRSFDGAMSRLFPVPREAQTSEHDLEEAGPRNWTWSKRILEATALDGGKIRSNHRLCLLGPDCRQCTVAVCIVQSVFI